MRVDKADLFEDISQSMDSWVEAVSDALIKPEADLAWVEDRDLYRKLQNELCISRVNGESIRRVLAECLRGFAVSFFATIDGDTALGEKGRVHLVDEDGRNLGESLHDDFVGYLMDSGRLQ